jgi:hypothetical protein
MQRFEGKRAFSLPSERVEARLAYIKTALKITDAQQPQWNVFADTLRKQAAEGDKRMQAWRAQAGQRTERQRPTAIARIEREQQRHAAAVVRLNELFAVEKPLTRRSRPTRSQLPTSCWCRATVVGCSATVECIVRGPNEHHIPPLIFRLGGDEAGTASRQMRSACSSKETESNLTGSVSICCAAQKRNPKATRIM